MKRLRKVFIKEHKQDASASMSWEQKNISQQTKHNVIEELSLNEQKKNWSENDDGNSRKKIQNTLLPIERELSGYEITMSEKRNYFVRLPINNSNELQIRLDTKWNEVIQYPLSPLSWLYDKHYEDMVKFDYSLDFIWFKEYATDKRNAWRSGKVGKLDYIFL